MDIDKIIDALVEATKKTITKEVEALRAEVKEDQRRSVISLTKSTIKREVETLGADLVAKLESMRPTDGRDGVDGQNGADGASVTLSDVEPMVKEWLESNITQPKDGTNGINGTDGQNGVDGLNGEKGADGENGRDGIDGRDALQIDILPEINPSKSYARGTYAQHDGGVFKASRTTDPLEGAEAHRAGWDVVLRGVAGVEVYTLDENTLAIKTRMTGGTDHITKVEIPTLIYKGVWQAGEYKRGATVTWGGSLWHCNKATDTKPGDSGDWTLAAKRGRDGKDLAKAAPVESKPVYLGGDK
jgi:hypothetical protein